MLSAPHPFPYPHTLLGPYSQYLKPNPSSQPPQPYGSVKSSTQLLSHLYESGKCPLGKKVPDASLTSKDFLALARYQPPFFHIVLLALCCLQRDVLFVSNLPGWRGVCLSHCSQRVAPNYLIHHYKGKEFVSLMKAYLIRFPIWNSHVCGFRLFSGWNFGTTIFI